MNRLRPLGLLVALLVGACGTGRSELLGDPSASDGHEALRTDARELLDAGEPEAARALLEDSFRDGVDGVRTRRLWQDVMAALGREDEARERVRMEVESGGGADARFLLARLEEDDEAERLLREALELRPDHVWSSYALGVLAARRGDFVAAEERLGEALDAAPAFAEARLRRAQVRDRRADFDGAANDYRAYLERRPDDVDALYDYASIVHRELQRPSEAEDLYRRLLDRDPLYAGATVGLAACLEERGRFEEAELLYLSVWNREPSALFNLGMLYQDRLERYEEARECFRRFLALETATDGPPVPIADRLIYAPLRLEELERRLAEGRE